MREQDEQTLYVPPSPLATWHRAFVWCIFVFALLVRAAYLKQLQTTPLWNDLPVDLGYYQRINPCTVASKASNWTNVADTSGNPGSGAASGCAKGFIINEFSDASGTGNFVYEFVELHNDK